MCLNINATSMAKTTAIKRKGGVVIAYKVITKDRQSPFYKEFVWPTKGIVESERKNAKRTKEENKSCNIYNGIHLLVNNNNKISNLYQCRYPCPYPYPYRYLCLNPCPRYIVIEVIVDVKDIISYGTWSHKESLVVTRCKVIENKQIGECK